MQEGSLVGLQVGLEGDHVGHTVGLPVGVKEGEKLDSQVGRDEDSAVGEDVTVVDGIKLGL